MWWIPLAIQGASMLMQGMNKRDASAEIPGMMESLQQSLQARQNALTYADAAANPDSPWFRNLAALYREAAFPEMLRGVKEGMRQQQRLTARGVPTSFVSNPERRDEAFYSSLARGYQKATVDSRLAAQNQLMNASRAASGAAPMPNGVFDILNRYGQANVDRTNTLIGGGADLAKKIFERYSSGGGHQPWMNFSAGPWQSGDPTAGFEAAGYLTS